MNSNSGGYDISSLTRHRSQANPGHHLSHASAFQAGQHNQQSLGHNHPLLIPNLGLGSHGVMAPNPSVMHHQHHQSLSGHASHAAHIQAASSTAGHHLPSQYSHALLQQMPIPHPSAAGSTLHHQSSPSLHHGQGSHFGSQVHQPVVVTPVVHPPPPASPSMAVPVVPEATNALASSVNLGAIQSLVDVLVDLPLPSEAPELGLKKAKLLEDVQLHACLSSLTMDHQNLLSQLLSPCLQNAKMQVSQMNASFTDRKETSNNRSQSTIHDKNAYLLSLLNHVNVFGQNAILPPAAPSGPQTRQQQQQYWNPWTENQQQPEQSLASVVSGQGVQSPYTSSPQQTSYSSSRSTQNQGTLFNNNHTCTDSNSSSSFTEPSTPTPMMTPSSVDNSVGHNIRYQNQQTHQPFHQTVSHVHQPQAEYQETLTSVDQPAMNANNNFPSMEPVIMLDKHDPALDRPLEAYYAKANGPDSSSRLVIY